MKVRFIVDSSDYLKVLSGRESENFVVLRRDNGFFVNRDFIKEHKHDDITIYTDDETILNYAPFVDGKYNIEFKFPEWGEFIPLSKLHPNIREVNNLTIMYQKEIFHKDFQEYMGN